MVENPIPVKKSRETGSGQYTEITSIQAPESASSGSLVQISVTIKNKYSSAIGIMVGGALEYGVSPWPTINFPDYWANVDSGDSKIFDGNFTMPAHDINIHAYSYYYTVDGWVFDDEKTKKVGAWISLATSSLSVKKAIVGAWISLATSSLSVKKGIIGGWVSLATVSLAVGVGIVSGQDIFKSLAVDFEKSLPKEFA